MLLGVTLLPRETLEARAVGGASTVQVDAVVCTTLTAHSEPYNPKVFHASQVNQSANASRTYGYGTRCGRGKPRLAAATSRRYRIGTGRDKVFGVCSGAPSFVPQRKTRSLWLPARLRAGSTVFRF